MGKRNVLNINGVMKETTSITYQDLIWLYQDFINKHGYVPTTNEGLLKNNLPQQRIIKKTLEKNNITMNDFLNQFGKLSHVRTESKDYDYFLQQFKRISMKKGRALYSSELINNSYGLPSASWFIKYCPDSSVESYNDFVKWCGFNSNIQKKDKSDVIKILHQLEKELGRPITTNDINKKNVGFSMIVINRIWGSLNNCKKEIGLLPASTLKPKSFEYYKNKLDLVLEDFSKNSNRKFIRWQDIENNPNIKLAHKSLANAFRREGLDVIAYIKSKGYDMSPSLFSFHYVFDDGEIAVSSYEYDFSNYLRQSGYIYNQTYYRNVMYKTFVSEEIQSKINCDYLINGVCVEIAGMISNSNNNWKTHPYKSKQEQEYQTQLINKENLLKNNNIPYIFLFPEDFVTQEYKYKIHEMIGKEVVYV